jgi:UDPglucose 6-dehydrogenase
MHRTKVGIMGLGMVGGALANYFRKNRDYVDGQDIFCFDPGKGMLDAAALNRADAVFVCVPTPYVTDPADGRLGFDLSFVRSAIETVEGSKIIVIKSTVRPGTTEQLQKEYPRHRFIFNPEFLTEVSADQDMNYPDRQIVGYTDQSYTVAGDVMHLLPLAPFERVMRAREAEMVKYFGNLWFSTKVVYANQMYDICEAMQIDYDTVKESAAADKRIGRTHLDVFHKGYRGYGGKCLPKDTRALIELGDELGVEMALLKRVEEINNRLVAAQGHDPNKTDRLGAPAPVLEKEKSAA